MHADVAIAARLASRKDHTFVRVMGVVSDVGDQPPLLVICGVLLTYGLVAGAPRARRAGVSMLGALLLATAAKAMVKGLVSRTRPNVLLDEGRYAVTLSGRVEDLQSLSRRDILPGALQSRERQPGPSRRIGGASTGPLQPLASPKFLAGHTIQQT